MAVNKIVIDNEIKIDLTADTVSPSTLALGITAHDKTGTIITGTMSGGGAGIEDLRFSGDFSYFDYNGRLDNLIKNNFDNVKLGGWTQNGEFKGVSSLYKAFYGSSLTKIPSITIIGNVDAREVFSGCVNLIQLPTIQSSTYNKIVDWNGMFSNCASLTNVLQDSLSPSMGYEGAYKSMEYCFENCINLKTMNDTGIFVHSNNYKGVFENCCQLSEIVGLYVPPGGISYSLTFLSNKFTDTFKNCVMLSKFTFATFADDYEWKSQVLDFTTCGYDTTNDHTYATNSWATKKSFTFDSAKQVTDATTYNQLKDTADWWTADVAYSKYDRQSAIATINSLPDTSAYIASKGGINTIKFKKGAGSAKGDLYNMSNLTAEEIAVATAKGWTVSLVN